jgi:hypothetical protein
MPSDFVPFESEQPLLNIGADVLTVLTVFGDEPFFQVTSVDGLECCTAASLKDYTATVAAYAAQLAVAIATMPALHVHPQLVYECFLHVLSLVRKVRVK